MNSSATLLRDEHLLLARPKLNLPTASETSEAGVFHHEVLRPLLKMQNELLLSQFRDWMVEHKQSLAGKSAEAQKELIEQACKTHKRLRAQAFGLIAGVMTTEEYRRYLTQQRELHKRITSMWTQRLWDQRSRLLETNEQP